MVPRIYRRVGLAIRTLYRLLFHRNTFRRYTLPPTCDLLPTYDSQPHRPSPSPSPATSSTVTVTCPPRPYSHFPAPPLFTIVPLPPPRGATGLSDLAADIVERLTTGRPYAGPQFREFAYYLIENTRSSAQVVVLALYYADKLTDVETVTRPELLFLGCLIIARKVRSIFFGGASCS
jgi:hypothetical protein